MNNEPIRILHVVTVMNRGGIESMLMTLFRNIDRSAVQFDFLVHRQERGAFDDEIESLGGKIHRLPPMRIKHVGGYLKKLDDFFRSNPQYRIVHSHLNANSFVVLRAAHRNGVKVRIAHSHNTRSTEKVPLQTDIKRLQKLFIGKYATHRYACSRQAARWLFGKALAENCFVLPNSIDTEKFAFSSEARSQYRREFGLDESDRVIGHVGRFSIQKNHGFLVDIFARVAAYDPKARLVLIGEGELFGQVKKKVSSLGLDDKVFFLGGRDDIPELLSMMDIFLFPSLFEGLSVVGIETQCSGLPFVCSEAMPQEGLFSDTVVRLPLSIGADKWAEKILTTPLNDEQSRKKACLTIREAGYDVKKNARIMEARYKELWTTDN